MTGGHRSAIPKSRRAVCHRLCAVAAEAGGPRHGTGAHVRNRTIRGDVVVLLLVLLLVPCAVHHGTARRARAVAGGNNVAGLVCSRVAVVERLLAAVAGAGNQAGRDAVRPVAGERACGLTTLLLVPSPGRRSAVVLLPGRLPNSPRRYRGGLSRRAGTLPVWVVVSRVGRVPGAPGVVAGVPPMSVVAGRAVTEVGEDRTRRKVGHDELPRCQRLLESVEKRVKAGRG